MSPVESIKQARAEPVPTSIPMKWSFGMSIVVSSILGIFAIEVVHKRMYASRFGSASNDGNDYKENWEVMVGISVGVGVVVVKLVVMMKSEGVRSEGVRVAVLEVR